jgi:hypothetical protein
MPLELAADSPIDWQIRHATGAYPVSPEEALEYADWLRKEQFQQNGMEGDGLLIAASEIKMENATFLSDPEVPLNYVTIIAGLGGLGKSHVTIDMTARATRGQLRGDLHGQPINCVIATAEDAHAQTMVPRLTAAGADISRVFFVNMDVEFTLPDDLDKLDVEIVRTGSRLLIIDPLVAYLSSDIDGHRDQHARTALRPLAAMASRHELAVVGVMHLTKASEVRTLFERVSGSGGFYNAARSVLLVGQDPENEATRVIAHGKHNLSLPASSRRFQVEGTELDEVDPRTSEKIRTSRIAWLGESNHTVADILGAGSAKPRDKATAWLRGQLSKGPVPAEWLKERAEEAGHAWGTVRRASEDLGVLKDKLGSKAGGSGRCRQRTTSDPKVFTSLRTEQVSTFGIHGRDLRV